MNPSPPSSPPPAARLRRLEWLAALAGLGTALGWLLLHTPPPAPLPEVPRAQLTLREGLLYSKDTAVPFTGIVTEYYEGGGRKSRSVVAQGFLEGLSEGWHTNGQKQIEEPFHAGVSHGRRVKWHPNGQKLAEVQVVQGQLEGLFRRWHANGALAEEIPMKAGQPDGPSRAFYPSGSLQAEARLQAGQVLEPHHWQNGQRPAGSVAQVAAH
jgi:hypothetical protein